MSGEPIRQGHVEANGISFGLLEAGPPGGPLALLLHGFPDTAWTWRHLLPVLGDAGFRVVAPFMRGYAPSSAAPDARYPVAALAADAVALHEALGGGEDAVIVGHDWGAVATYGAAAYAPERFHKVVTGAVPPPLLFMQSLFRYAQLKKSWYMFFFQTPMADAAVASDDMAFVRGLWQDWSPGYDASFDVARVVESIGEPDRLSAAIGYYRAMFDPTHTVPELEPYAAASMQPTPQPTLYYHGLDDGCFGAEGVTDETLAYLGPGSEILMISEAGHFAHLERPDVVNEKILAWLSQSCQASA